MESTEVVGQRGHPLPRSINDSRSAQVSGCNTSSQGASKSASIRLRNRSGPAPIISACRSAWRRQYSSSVNSPERNLRQSGSAVGSKRPARSMLPGARPSHRSDPHDRRPRYPAQGLEMNSTGLGGAPDRDHGEWREVGSGAGEQPGGVNDQHPVQVLGGDPEFVPQSGDDPSHHVGVPHAAVGGEHHLEVDVTGQYQTVGITL